MLVRSSVVGRFALLSFLCLTGCAGSSSAPKEAPVPTAPAAQSPAASGDQGPTDADAPKEFTKTESGLKYRILRKSDGEKPTASNSVVAHYRGWLDDGTEFDSSYKRGEPTEFPLGGVIPGWTEGLQFVGKGGMIELEIPSDLGYGPRGMPPTIPGGATLHFIVELKEIK